MSKSILIGREGNQPFAIGDPRVSKRHAILTIEDNGRLILLDNRSSNGTFIHDGRSFNRIYPNQPHLVTPDTMIQLGSDTRFHVRRLLANQNISGVAGHNRQPKPKPEKKSPPKANIFFLRQVSEQYNETKLEIESKITSVNSLRSSTIIIVSVAGLLSSLSTNLFDIDASETTAYIIKGGVAVVVSVILFAILTSYTNSKMKKLNRMRQLNEQQYAEKYCCPTCRASFRGKYFANVLGEGSCPRCNTKFYDAGPDLAPPGYGMPMQPPMPGNPLITPNFK